MNCPFPWQRRPSTVTSSVAVHPISLAQHPQSWTKEEVGKWLQWCAEEYSIEPVPTEKFDLNGKALCLLSRNDFIERLPSNGDVLYNSLQTLISKNTGGSIVYQDSISSPEARVPTAEPLLSSALPLAESVPAGLLLLPTVCTAQSTLGSNPVFPGRSYVPIRPHPVFTETMCDSSALATAMSGSSEIRTEARSTTDDLTGVHEFRRSDCRLLWEFIYQLLINSKYRDYVSWENRDEHVFRIVNPTGLAELWGQQKNRTNMTYEKLSRALRYYYRMNIIQKVPGKRLTYRFLQSPTRIQKGQRGAKPHCKYQLNYKHCKETAADRSPSAGEQTSRDTPGHISTPSDMKDSSSDLNEEFDKDSPEVLDTKTFSLFKKEEDRKLFADDFETDLVFQPYEGPSKYDSHSLFPIPISCSAKHIVHNLPSSSSAFRPIHQSYDNTFGGVQSIKKEGTDSDFVPSFSTPLVGATNFTGAPRVKDDAAIKNSMMIFHPALRTQEGFQRSLSEDCVPALQLPRCLFRPHTTTAKSPGHEVQIEPEDLSVRKTSVDTKSTDDQKDT